MLGRFVTAVRRNHALEHATVTVMLSRIPPTRMIARAKTDGFFLWAKVSEDLLEECVREALVRLKRGEGHLAVSPLCGTNLAIGGLLAGGASMLALGQRRGIDRLPAVATAAMFGLIAAQPIGRLAQRHVTTSPDAEYMELESVRRLGPSLYRVKTSWNEPASDGIPEHYRRADTSALG